MDPVLRIQTKKTCKHLGHLFGIFFEDINNAADGGLYGELVQNRSFEFDPVDNPEFNAMTAWDVVQRKGSACSVHIEQHHPLNSNNPHYLVLEVLSEGEGAGIANRGYNTGIPLRKGAEYRFSLYARQISKSVSPLEIRLESSTGIIYGNTEIHPDSHEWKQYHASLVSSEEDFSGRLVILARKKTTVALDMISLFPKDTFRGRENGLRKDIAELLADLRPRFMRFPGGCLVHSGSLDPDDRISMYRWKNTIGDVAARPPRRNNWRYNQTLGLGFYEYFLFAEDIGAEPLPILPAGYDPHSRRAAPLDEMEPWIQDALDLIEFANGGPDTAWGKKRAELGHPEPFNLKYLGIGNEEVGEDFFERYKLIHKRVKEKYPEIKLINTAGPNAAGSEFERGWASARENGSDYVDEHYYQAPEWFMANMHRYANYPENGPRVFLGEYASWGSSYRNALVEAAFMIGLEKAPAVGLACYAPLLSNADYQKWYPDLIYFNNHQAFGSACYYVQKLFMNHQGDDLLAVSADHLPEPEKTYEPIRGKIVVVPTKATVQYKDFELVDPHTGMVRKLPDVLTGGASLIPVAETEGDFILRFTAVKLDESNQASPFGERGLEIRFGWQNEDNYLSWRIGAWQNQDSFLRSVVSGKSSDLTQSLFTVKEDVEYRCELRVTQRKMSGIINGSVINEAEDSLPVIDPLYYTASLDRESGDIIVKVVNLTEHERRVTISLEQYGAQGLNGTLYEMKGYDPDDENSFDDPKKVAYTERPFRAEKPEFEHIFEPRSLSVFRFHA
jgi:alpha-L-arabinofuranosidase